MRRIQILLIEDDRDLAFALNTELTAEGYELTTAYDGRTGLDNARLGGFDLILLDVKLPKLDGYTICRDLRTAHDRTPILMLTAKGLEAEKVLGLEVGADDYLVKPYSSLELRARVRALLRRSGVDTAEIYQFGDVAVNMIKGEVRRDGEIVELTSLEFKLLCTFIKRREHILTRQQLLDDAWPTDSNPTDRAIDQHVMHLRGKLEPNPEKPRFFVGIRGLGYRFDG